MHASNIVFVIGSPVRNKGSEAIVRGFAEICRGLPVAPCITLSAVDPEFGSWLALPGVHAYLPRPGFGRFGRVLDYGVRRARNRLGSKRLDLFVRLVHRSLLDAVASAELVVFVGADNYDAAYGSRRPHHELNALLRAAARGRTLLYDCSLAEADLDEESVASFRTFDAITVREGMTLDLFRRHLDPARVHYFPDPAFLMPAEPFELPAGWQVGRTVGVNISNLVASARYGGGQEFVLDAYRALIAFILRETELQVALIPHVMKNADLSMLRPLYEHFRASGRLLLVEDETLSAPRLTYLISQCRLYVGARTHSTIAAYSSGVPTLVLGYSVKSIGIARDLFGTEQDHVVAVQQLGSRDDLARAFQKLLGREAAERSHLASRLPAYLDKARGMADLLARLLQGPQRGRT